LEDTSAKTTNVNNILSNMDDNCMHFANVELNIRLERDQKRYFLLNHHKQD
jgi:hypothetical protein